MSDNIEETSKKLIDQLSVVRDEFIRNKEELAVSIRKDIVMIELKDILQKNLTYNELKNALEEYISALKKIEVRGSNERK